MSNPVASSSFWPLRSLGTYAYSFHDVSSLVSCAMGHDGNLSLQSSHLPNIQSCFQFRNFTLMTELKTYSSHNPHVKASPASPKDVVFIITALGSAHVQAPSSEAACQQPHMEHTLFKNSAKPSQRQHMQNFLFACLMQKQRLALKRLNVITPGSLDAHLDSFHIRYVSVAKAFL